MHDPDGSEENDLFMSSSPSVNYRQHPSGVHARAASGMEFLKKLDLSKKILIIL